MESVQSTAGQKVPLGLSFFPDGFGAHIPVIKLVKDLRVQAGNVFPSAQCIDAANQARRLIIMTRHFFQNWLSYAALLRPQLEYGMLACSQSLVRDINHLAHLSHISLIPNPSSHHLHFVRLH